MASPDPMSALWVPGRLSVNPSNLSNAWPHGGTGLGLVQAARWMRQLRKEAIPAEELGGAPQDVAYLGESPGFEVTLRGFDPDAIAQVFENTGAGSVTGAIAIRWDPDASPRPGALLGSDNAVDLLFTPDEPDLHRAVRIRNCVPMTVEQFTVDLDLENEHLIATRWMALPSETDSVNGFEVELLQDLA